MFSVQKNACFNGVKGGFERQNTWHAKNGRPSNAMIFLVWPWHSMTNPKMKLKHRLDVYMQAIQLIHLISTHSDKAAQMFSVQKNACFNGVKDGFDRQNTWHAKNGRPLNAMIFLVSPWHSTTNPKITLKHRPDMYMQAKQ
jgi:hypothetical protein